MREYLKEYSIRYDRWGLSMLCPPDRNGDFNLYEIASGNKRKVWW